MSRGVATAFGFGAFVLVASCTGDDPGVAANDPDAGGSTQRGAKGEPCYPNDTCDPGLTCKSGTCFVSTDDDGGATDGGMTVTDGAACDAASMCGGKCVDLSGDDKNCGTCGHDCLGGPCMSGKCKPVKLVDGQTGIYWITIDANNVYWGAGASISKCTSRR